MQKKSQKISNFLILTIFGGNPQGMTALQKLKGCLSGTVMNKFFTFCKGITESKEFKSLEESREELIKRFESEQAALPVEQRLPAVADSVKGYNELMSEEFALKIGRFDLSLSSIGNYKDQEKNVNGNDRELLELIINFSD